MVDIRRSKGRFNKAKTKSKSLCSLPKVVIVLAVLLLGTTLLNLFKTTNSPNNGVNVNVGVDEDQAAGGHSDSSDHKRKPLGLDGRLKDSRGNLRPKPPLPKPKFPKPKPPPPKLERFQEDHDVDPVNGNQKDHHQDDKQEKNHNGKSKDKDGSASPDEEHQEPELPDDQEHEQHHEEEPDVAVHENENDGVEKQPPLPGSAKFEAATSRTGTGPTKMAYVKDFDHERANPTFRTATVARTMEDASSLAAKIAKMVDESSVTPCILSSPGGNKDQTTTTTTTTTDPKCLDTDTPLIVYNSATFERTWCGTQVAPLTAVKLAQDCDRSELEPATGIAAVVHLFPTDFPPISGQGMPPVLIKSHDDVIVIDPKDVEKVECNIPCQQEKAMDGKTRVIDGTHWSFTQTTDDSWAHQYAKIERTDFRNDHYYATQSWLSSVPLSVWDFSKYSMRRPAVSWDTAQNKGVYMVNSACSSPASKRQKYFGATASQIKVDAIGTCHHNADVPAGMTMDTIEGRVEIMKQYRMVLAFDATTEKDHISEIIWEAYMSGAVPVVVGADNLMADHHLPPHSAILGGEFTNWDEMAAHVKLVAENKTLWESYHTWRNDESLIQAFEEKYQFTKTDPTCRMCRWAYAKKFGLGWDHAKQEVVEAKLPRQLCISSANNKGLVSKPFQEGWIHRSDQDETAELIVHHGGGGDGESPSSDSTCTSVTVEGTIDTDAYKVHRKIHQHDSITDMIITGVEREEHEGQVILRLEFPGVRNFDEAFFRNPHTLVPTKGGALASSATMQDKFAKVTILADWVTSISCPQEGVLEVVVEQDKEGAMAEGVTKRIRVITEDLNVIHDKMTEFFPSSFAKVMTKDFIDPLELFYADS